MPAGLSHVPAYTDIGSSNLMDTIISQAPFKIMKNKNGKECTGLFRDDGLALVYGLTEDDVKWVNDWFDSLFPNFKFEIKIAKCIEFLDIKISIVNNEIFTCPYSKPSASHKYVPPKSCHDRKIITSIPYSVFYRLKLLSSTKESFEVAAKEYSCYLINSGYDENLLEKKLNEIRLLNRETMLKDNKKKINNDFIAALVVDNHPGLPNIREAWRQARAIVSLDPIANK